MKKYIILPLVFLSLISLNSCSSLNTEDSLEKDTSFTAQLDYSENVIVKPVDEYVANSDNIARYNAAHSIIFNECLSEKGYSYPLGQVDEKSKGSREYGMWNPEYTQKYGYGFTSEVINKQDSDNNLLQDIPTEEMDSCYDESKEKLEEIEFISEDNSIAARIRNQAYQEATFDPEWSEARKEWWQCLEENGLTPSKEANDWVSEEGAKISLEPDLTSNAVQAEMIRISTIEATCSKEKGTAQKLANLEAAYQGPLIKENQTALNAEKEELQEKVRKIEEYISKNG